MPIEDINKIEQSELNPEMQQEQIASGNASTPNEELPGEEVIESLKKGDTIMWKGRLAKIINVLEG